MIVMSYRLASILLLVVAQGCRNESYQSPCMPASNLLNQFEQIARISIPVPDSLNYALSFPFLHCFDSTSCLYFGLDETNNSIDVYDMINRAVLSSTRFRNDGSPASFSIEGYFVHNPDSIFLYSEEPPALLLMDYRGNVQERWSLREAALNLADSSSGYFIALLDNEMIFVKSHGIVYFKFSHEWTDPGDTRFFSEPFMAGYHLQTGRFTPIFGRFPEESRLHPNPLSVGFGIVGRGQQNGILLNLFGSHRLWEVTPDGILEGLCRKSHYLPDRLPPFGSDAFGNFYAFQQYLTHNGYYTKCILDKHGSVRYCIVKHGVDLFFPDRMATAFDASFSCIIFDNNQPESEVLFPAKVYNYFNAHYFLGDLMVDRNNVLNSDHREGVWEFDVLRPVK